MRVPGLKTGKTELYYLHWSLLDQGGGRYRKKEEIRMNECEKGGRYGREEERRGKNDCVCVRWVWREKTRINKKEHIENREKQRQKGGPVKVRRQRNF